MKSLIVSLINRIFQKNRVINFLLNRFLQPNLLTKDAKLKILQIFREEIKLELFKYPSVLDCGYLHIERAIRLIKARNLDALKILDIGAARGETCMLFAKALPQALIIGFEPIVKTFEQLEENTKDFANIAVYNIALGREKAVSSINIMSRVTSSSIYPSRVESSFGGLKYFSILERQRINIAALDDFDYRHDSIALIKIDVQGFELEVLSGGLKTLLSTHFILVELQNHDVYIGAPRYYDIDLFLRKVGFELFDVIPSIRENEQIKEFDSIYINKNIYN